MKFMELKVSILELEQQSLKMKVHLSELTAKKRKKLPSVEFVFPADKRYPIHDLAHARNALARSSGKPEEEKVKAAVYRKYPELKSGAE